MRIWGCWTASLGCSKVAIETKLRINPWVFWAFIPISIIPLVYSVPRTYERLLVERAIDQYGAFATGIVVAHSRASGSGRGTCPSRVTVSYEVAGQNYQMTSMVCDTSQDQMPVGRAIDVRYLPSSPKSAIVSTPQSRSSRTGWSDLVVQLAIPVALGWFGWAVRKNEKNAPG